ncbi:MAG: hypothetical protein KAS23_16320 [Anaerohalosphaera sp.]|nr:hypothetical protein [Anaerohalosphaera sp.]
MITKKTVLVLGAGASMPYGFPSGWGLVKEICSRFDHVNRADTVTLAKAGYLSSDMVEFAKSLSVSGQSSVDAFLEHRPEYIDVGKAAIAYVLKYYESHVNLFDLGTEKNWYKLFWSRLSTSINSFQYNKLSIITFNYDRSLEQYLFTAMSNSYGLNEDQCAYKLKSIPIIHVHGKLGRLNWEDSTLESVDFGVSETNPNVIRKASSGIKIIHENIEDDQEFEAAERLLRKADRIYFLGFGYHPTNWERLGLDYYCKEVAKPTGPRPEIAGTGYGLSRQVKEEIERVRQRPDTPPVVSLYDSKVYDFLYNDIVLD